MTRPDHEIDAFLEGQLTDEQARVLDDWIAADPANAAAFLHLSRTHQVLTVLGKENLVNRQTEQAIVDAFDMESDLDLLGSLAEMEASAETSQYPVAISPGTGSAKDQDITLSHALSELRWVAGKSANRLLHSKPVITSAVAAVLLIALTLFLVFSGGQDKPITDPLANTPLWDTPPQAHQPVVATLTDSVGAQWRSYDKPVPMPMGAQLVAFERYTLTHGFAEITTQRGAVAILEAPATIELLDGDNALRLHAGKLVGICLTERSKGFVVRTPSMDVIDLGTEFGVHVEGDAVVATVFSGEVELVADDDDIRLALERGQTARLSDQAGSDLTISIEQQVDQGFTQLHQQFAKTVQPLPGTGFGTKINGIDPNWHVVACNDRPFDSPQPLRAIAARGYHAVLPGSDAQWLNWDLSLSPDHPASQLKGSVSFLFRTVIDLPESMDPSQTQIAMHYAADNRLHAIRVNGERIVLEDLSKGGVLIRSTRYASVTEHLVRGENTIDFEVINFQNNEVIDGPGAVSFYLDWKLIGREMKPIDSASGSSGGSRQ
ncbi:MAG: FecR family protein [Phycisphaeraceae bacterium]|nr:FecR family protein [Phycisphaeraceae bacterium]